MPVAFVRANLEQRVKEIKVWKGLIPSFTNV